MTRKSRNLCLGLVPPHALLGQKRRFRLVSVPDCLCRSPCRPFLSPTDVWSGLLGSKTSPVTSDLKENNNNVRLEIFYFKELSAPTRTRNFKEVSYAYVPIVCAVCMRVKNLRYK